MMKWREKKYEKTLKIEKNINRTIKMYAFKFF